MTARTIQRTDGPLEATFRAPPSKSVTHRALVAAALASGPSTIVGPLDAEDTRVTLKALGALGFRVRAGDSGWEVHGLGGEVRGGSEIDLAESGTSFRILTAVASLGTRPSRLDGAPRLRERPIGELAAALRSLGAHLELSAKVEGLPIRVGGVPLRGGRVVLSAKRSSQFATALLMVGSRLEKGLELVLEPPVVSLPYVDLTVAVLEAFGVEVNRPEELRWLVSPGDYPGRKYVVEGDHSSASYFLAAAAVVGGRVRIEHLDPGSAQPDGRLGLVLERLGCVVRRGPDWVEVEGTGSIPPFDLDLSASPDLVPTLAILALFADGPCSMRGIAHLRLKESDRLALLAGNLRKLGRDAAATEDALLVKAPSGKALEGATIETASDHRMAMAFSVAGLRVGGVRVDDAGCVAKSNRDFWKDLSRLEGGEPR